MTTISHDTDQHVSLQDEILGIYDQLDPKRQARLVRQAAHLLEERTGCDHRVRITNTQPECPPWCEVSAEDHEAEACERIGSWFAHVRQVKAGAVSLTVTSCQQFEEQVEGYEEQAGEALIPAFFIDIDSQITDSRESLTAAEALEAAEAITRFVQEVTAE